MPPSPPLLRRVLALFVATLALGHASRASDPSPAGSSPPDACSGTFDASVDARAASCATISGTLLVTARVLRAFTAASPSGGTLRRVDGDVLVRDNHLERSLNDAFPALRSVGGSVVLAADAEDVLVATAPPHDLSARNAFEVAITGLVEGAGAVVVEAGPWRALLTAAAARELDLETGRRAWLVVKTHGWRVLAG